jgi:hypothetical protein
MAIPNQIPPADNPWCYQNASGEFVIEPTWYLFLYGLWNELTDGQTDAELSDLQLVDTSAIAAQQSALNAFAAIPDQLPAAPSIDLTVLVSDLEAQIEQLRGIVKALKTGGGVAGFPSTTAIINAAASNTQFQMILPLNVLKISRVTGSSGIYINVFTRSGAGAITFISFRNTLSTGATIAVKITVDGIVVFNPTAIFCGDQTVGTYAVGTPGSTANPYAGGDTEPIRYNSTISVDVANMDGSGATIETAYILHAN